MALGGHLLRVTVRCHRRLEINGSLPVRPTPDGVDPTAGSSDFVTRSCNRKENDWNGCPCTRFSARRIPDEGPSTRHAKGLVPHGSGGLSPASPSAQGDMSLVAEQTNGEYRRSSDGEPLATGCADEGVEEPDGENADRQSITKHCPRPHPGTSGCSRRTVLDVR